MGWNWRVAPAGGAGAAAASLDGDDGAGDVTAVGLTFSRAPYFKVVGCAELGHELSGSGAFQLR